MTPELLVSICPDTGRAFLCLSGQDNNVAEIFDGSIEGAKDTAFNIASRFNAHDALVKVLESNRSFIHEHATRFDNSRAVELLETTDAAIALAEGKA